MIRISDAAQAHFAKLLANQEEGTQIRVFVINPGTPNAECGVSYCPPDAVEATDTALKFDLLTAYVDELSAPYLEDAEIDFVTDQLGSQLTLKAPNAKMRKVADDAVRVGLHSISKFAARVRRSIHSRGWEDKFCFHFVVTFLHLPLCWRSPPPYLLANLPSSLMILGIARTTKTRCWRCLPLSPSLYYPIHRTPERWRPKRITAVTKC